MAARQLYHKTEQNSNEEMLPNSRLRGLIFRCVTAGVIFLSVLWMKKTDFSYKGWDQTAVKEIIVSSESVKEIEQTIRNVLKKCLPNL